MHQHCRREYHTIMASKDHLLVQYPQIYIFIYLHIYIYIYKYKYISFEIMEAHVCMWILEIPEILGPHSVLMYLQAYESAPLQLSLPYFHLSYDLQTSIETVPGTSREKYTYQHQHMNWHRFYFWIYFIRTRSTKQHIHNSWTLQFKDQRSWTIVWCNLN